MAQFGLFASTLISWLLIPTFGWRAMFVIAGIGALIVFVARKVIPESPRWLESNGRVEEAQKIVSQIEARAGQATLPPVAAAATPSPVASSTGLFDSALLRPLGLGALTQIIQSVAIYGFVAWVPTFLVKQGIPINQTLGLAVLMSFGGPAGALLAFLLTDRIGRRPAIIGGSFAAMVVGPLFALATSQVVAVVLGFSLFSLIYFLVSVIQAGYLPELFPTAVRMRATSLCVTAGRVTAIGLPFAIVALFQWNGVMAVVGLVSVLLVLQIIAVILLGRETRGQSLESIGEEPEGRMRPAEA
jgi:putative MFS transporter